MAGYTFQSLNLRAEIGGNCYALDLAGETILLDAGMHPKEDGANALPRYHDLPFDSAAAIIISHSHLDHIGTLPVAQRDHPSSPVYLTAPCAALGEALLHNSVNVMKSQREELGIPEYPLYHHREIDYLRDRWMIRAYESPFPIDPQSDESAEVTFYDAGHILGSAGVKIEVDGKVIFYTGDVNFRGHTLIKGARFPELENPDLLIMETTRGADLRPDTYTRRDEEVRLAASIREALEAGGSALIPVFAIGKTQEVLTMIDQFKSEGLVPERTPVFIGGLSTKMTVIYDSFSDSTRRHRPNFEILRDMKVHTGSKRRRAPIEYKPGAIYCLSSGMMSEKTTSNIFARSFLQNASNSLLFVGYAEPSTPAGAIKRASTGDVIRLDAAHKIQLNCTVDEFDFSGHARREELVEFAVKSAPKTLLLVHGDPDAAAWFKEELTAKLPDTKIVIPEPQQKISF